MGLQGDNRDPSIGRELNILASCQLNKKTITPSALVWNTPQRRKNKDFYSSLMNPYLFFSLLFFFCLVFFSLPCNHCNLFYITRLSLWNNRGRLITFPGAALSFFCQGEEKGKDWDDKRTVALVKGQPLWSHCCSFWPFQEENFVFHYLGMEFNLFLWQLSQK